MNTVQKSFVEELISMNALQRDLVEYQEKEEMLIIHDEIGLEYSIIKEIPSNITIQGNLNLSNTMILERIGDNVCVQGDLILSHSAIKEMGSNLNILGDLELMDCQIRAIPKDISVKGTIKITGVKGLRIPQGLKVINNMSISNCDIRRLPEDLAVGGDLRISSCNNLKEISNIRVGGNLRISSCNNLKEISNIRVGQDLTISSCNMLSSMNKINVQRDLKIFRCDALNIFPNDVSIGRNIWLKDNKNLQKLPDQFVINGDLDLSGTKITHLPDGLRVDGSLTLCGCKEINELPNHIMVGGSLDLSNTEIDRIPDCLSEIKGNLILNNSKVKHLPENLLVRGRLEIMQYEMKEIPGNIEVVGKVVKEIEQVSIEQVSIENNNDLYRFLLEEKIINQDKIRAEGERLVIDSSLDLTGYQIEQLDVNLLINGDLSLKNVREINGNITVNGELKMSCSMIENFNCSIVVNGDMDLSFSKIKNYPDKLVVSGDLDMSWIEVYQRLPEEIDVKGNFRLDNKDEETQLPKKITVGQDAVIETDYLYGLEEINVQGDLEFTYGLKEEDVACDISVGGNLDLSFSEITEISGKVIVGGNLNLAHTTKLETMAPSVKAGKRLILNSSLLNTIKIKEAAEKGCLLDNTVIEGNIKFSPRDLDVSRIGNNVKIFGNVEFAYCNIEGIGDNFTVYGDLKFKKVNIKNIGDGLTIYGNAHIINSNLDSIGSQNIRGKLVLEGINVNFSGDVKIGQYIYAIDSNVNTTHDFLIYNYNDFINQFQEHIGVADYIVEREVEAYFKLDSEIKRLVEKLEMPQLTNKVLQLETRSLLDKFVGSLVKTCEMIKNDPTVLTASYDHIVFEMADGHVKCLIKKYRENMVISQFELDDYRSIKEEISLIENGKTRKYYDSLLDLIINKILLRDFTLLQMNQVMVSLEEWGNPFAEEMYYRFLEDRDEDDDIPTDYDLRVVLNLSQDEFRFFIGSYYKW